MLNFCIQAPNFRQFSLLGFGKCALSFVVIWPSNAALRSQVSITIIVLIMKNLGLPGLPVRTSGQSNCTWSGNMDFLLRSGCP
jgi:hypothetical protein